MCQCRMEVIITCCSTGFVVSQGRIAPFVTRVTARHNDPCLFCEAKECGIGQIEAIQAMMLITEYDKNPLTEDMLDHIVSIWRDDQGKGVKSATRRK